jgi:hypothetical protein
MQMHNKQVAYCIAALAFIATSIQLLKWDMFHEKVPKKWTPNSQFIVTSSQHSQHVGPNEDYTVL